MNPITLTLLFVTYVVANVEPTGHQWSPWSGFSKSGYYGKDKSGDYKLTDDSHEIRLASRTGASKTSTDAYERDYAASSASGGNDYAEASEYGGGGSESYGGGVRSYGGGGGSYGRVGGRRKRAAEEAEDSLQSTYPLLEMISKNGFESMENPECQKKYICDIISFGNHPEANSLQKSLWYLSGLFPDQMSEFLGIGSVQTLLKNSRTGNCSQYLCKTKQSKTKSDTKV